VAERGERSCPAGEVEAVAAGLAEPAAGVSRKRFIGEILDMPVDQRLEGSLAAATIAVFQGARIIRTHDVAPTVKAVRIAEALRNARQESEPAMG